jgi:hypothetical protein
MTPASRSTSRHEELGCGLPWLTKRITARDGT